ncbi:PREDICTED: mitochondrial intermediate peptidase [Nicrophorus vespilloides]|uniref:Mitochondrial intermediate peptidase n=1 Tax=Nicrophorus vespilloides TaxID=110193 RepID=A0ABM1NGM7_NICVS|nr:PREDICTED: mitochondrial intermediate peptidase [Nicrophorus vespilloides]
MSRFFFDRFFARRLSQRGYSTSWSDLANAFNTRPTTQLNLSLVKENKGLFEVPELSSYEGFYLLKDRCISETNGLIQEAISENRTRKMVEIFDELSDNLCKVADLAEFIRLAHPSGKYKQAAEIACGAVSGIVEKLNTHKSLYDALQRVVKEGDLIPTNDVDNHVAQLFLFDFEQSGIHLPEAERNKVVALNDSILHLGQHFVAGAANPRKIKKQQLPQYIQHVFPADGDNVLVSGLNAESTNPVARELAYRIYLHPDPHQDYLLTELLKARHELAVICGFQTYAERALKGSMVETPNTAMDFLNLLSTNLRERAENDFNVMAMMKKADNPQSGALSAWDIPYFTQKYKKEKFKVASSEYSPYFSLGSCMEGLNILFNRLYGISLDNKEIFNGEVWTSDVYKLAVTHETEGLLGYIYCDFYERDGKPNQDCHFTIRGGKLMADGSYQLPIVVLMLNLPMPRWSTPSLLTPSMVDNLFHEMGHAMHSMLGRTRYQHVTGTRCSTDFAEVPSVLMEFFARDPRVLRTFARHFQTKEAMPEDMLQRLCASKHLFTASEMQIQLFYSALDQNYHVRHPLNGNTTDVLEATQNNFYSLPYIKDTAWQLRFSHLVGYGAKYYSYLVSTALASWIWQTYFEADPLSRTQGERYRRECLAHGGGKSPWNLVADFLQKEPLPSHLVESIIHEVDSKNELMEQVAKIYKN